MHISWRTKLGPEYFDPMSAICCLFFRLFSVLFGRLLFCQVATPLVCQQNSTILSWEETFPFLLQHMLANSQFWLLEWLMNKPWTHCGSSCLTSTLLVVTFSEECFACVGNTFSSFKSRSRRVRHRKTKYLFGYKQAEWDWLNTFCFNLPL